jgi:hypothetical protein
VEYAVSRRKQDETYTFTIQNWLGKGKWRNSYADLVKSLDPAYAIEYQEALKVKQNQSPAYGYVVRAQDKECKVIESCRLEQLGKGTLHVCEYRAVEPRMDLAEVGEG